MWGFWYESLCFLLIKIIIKNSANFYTKYIDIFTHKLSMNSVLILKTFLERKLNEKLKGFM